MKTATSLTKTFVIAAIFACLGLSAWLELNGLGKIVWAKFLPLYLIAITLIAIGALYQRSRERQRLATVLTVTGLYIAFTNAGATLNYLLYPMGTMAMDNFLMRIDASIGFDWLSYVTFFEGRSTLSWLLRWVYESSLLQLLAVIIFLGFSGRTNRLYEFLLVGVSTSLISIFIWSIAPSFGPASIVQPSPRLAQDLGLVIDARYVSHLAAVASGTIGPIEPASLQGLIAFPSMHSVMMLMVLWYTARTPVFPYFVALNIPMVPAILLHGGHHLIDVLGGGVLFLIMVWCVRFIFSERRSDVEKSHSYRPALPAVAAPGP